MDGSGREIVIQLNEDFAKCDRSCKNVTAHCMVKWPNQMELNYTSDELYWVDGQQDILESVGIDGNNHRVLLRNVTHCFGLGLGDDVVYFTSWFPSDQGLFSLLKWHNNDPYSYQSLRHDITGRPMDVAVVRKDKRPMGEYSRLVVIV